MKKYLDFQSFEGASVGLLLVVAVLSTIYYGLIARDRYASVSVVAITDTSSAAMASSGAASLLAAVGGAASHGDALYLQSYIRSMDMLNRLDKQFDLRAHYSVPSVDFFYRLSPSAKNEEFLEYFRSRVSVSLDDFSGLLTIEVQGFDREFSQTLSKAIIANGEALINENSHRIARERMAFAESEVQRALGRVQKAKAEVIAFQSKNKLMDPLSQSTAASSLLASLQATQAKQEADLKAAQAFMSEDSLQVRSLRGQLEATKSQLEAERIRATTVQGNTLPTLNVEFQALLTQATYAEETYKASTIAYEQARLDASRKLKAVMVMEPSTLPDKATYPRRILEWLTALAISVMVFTILRLVHATIKEHQD